MKSDQFARIKHGRLDRVRRHLFDPTLTDKQRRELRREVRRRESLGNQRRRDPLIRNRINASIRSVTTPRSLRSTASRYKNAMTPSQRRNVASKSKTVRQDTEDRLLANLYRHQDYKKFLASIRTLRKDLQTSKDMLSRNRVR